MRPYLAILHDSLREALYSRVLWILLILIAVVLLALAPLTITYPRTGRFFGDDIRDIEELAALLSQAQNSTATPDRRIWDHLDAQLQEDLTNLTEATEPDRRTRFRTTRLLLKQLNEALDDEQLLLPDQLAQLSLTAEGRQLRDEGVAGNEQLRRLNRLAMEALFPDQFQPRSAKVVQINYLIWPLGDAIPLSEQRVHDVVDLILVGFMNFFVGLVGVLAGVLVTASIVPNTFDAGSINLLLSKPISRPLLYLTKVVGGCWFVLINAAFLVVGLWLLVGLRLGVWNTKLLWSIPLFLFIFLVYYSVSAFAGLIWRNTIVSIVVTVIFWFACFLVGVAHDTIENLVIAPHRFGKIVTAGEDLFAVTQSGAVQRWAAEVRQWQAAFGGTEDEAPAFARRDALLGPIYDVQEDRLIAIERRGSQSSLVEGRRDTDFERDRLDRAPASCQAITINQASEILVADSESISRIQAKPTTEVKDLKLFGMKIPLGPKRGSFESLGPRGGLPEFSRKTAACFSVSDDAFFVLAESTLRRWERNDGRYALAAEVAMAGEYEDRQALLAAGGGFVVIGQADGTIIQCAAQDLHEISRHRPVDDSLPRHLAVAADGTVAVLYQNHHLWLSPGAGSQPVELPCQDEITAFQWTHDGQLKLADKHRVVYAVDTRSGTSTAYRPKQTALERVHQYIISPLYTVFPKPGKLKETNAYLLTKPSALLEMAGAALDEPQPQLDPWTPVWSSGAFALAMLALACLYIQRQEF